MLCAGAVRFDINLRPLKFNYLYVSTEFDDVVVEFVGVYLV